MEYPYLLSRKADSTKCNSLSEMLEISEETSSLLEAGAHFEQCHHQALQNEYDQDPKI